jgi:hypothetical protein
VAPVDNLPGYSYGQLTVTGITTSGGTVTYAFDFPALAGGSSPFVTADLAPSSAAPASAASPSAPASSPTPAA